MVLVAVAIAVVATVVPASRAVVEIVTAKPAGAAWTALAEIKTASPLAPIVTFREKFTQPFHGAADALLCGLVADAENLRHLLRRLAFEVTQQQGLAVRLAQLAQRGIQMRCDVFPAGIRFGGKQFVHGNGLLFTIATAYLGADGIGGEVLCRAMQPAGQNRPVGQLWRIFCEGHKYTLGHVLGQVCVPDHSQRGGINEVNVPADEFGKRGLRAAPGIIA